MINVYIDESGSMTTKYSKHYPYFVIALLVVKDKNKLRRAYKRFISKNIESLRTTDIKGKMFNNDSFIELKGSCLTEEMKISFLDYFCRNDYFEVFYIRINNSEIRYGLYNNTARAFNFVLKNAIESFLRRKLLPTDSFYLHIDERNERANSMHDLVGYLNIELHTGHALADEFQVKYYDSSNNIFIQIADVFSNIYYVHLLNGSLKEKLKEKQKAGYIKGLYKYPKNIL